MATILWCLFIFVNFLQIIKHSVGQTENLQQKFTTRCDEICDKNSINATEVCLVSIFCEMLVALTEQAHFARTSTNKNSSFRMLDQNAIEAVNISTLNF